MSTSFGYSEARQFLMDALGRSVLGCPALLRSSRLTQEAVLKLADDLLVAHDPATVCLLLCVFTAHDFPHPPGALLALVDHSDEQLAGRAIMALKRLAHPQVRTLALRLLASDRPLRFQSAGLLLHNFQPGDGALLRSVLSEAQGVDDDLLHTFCRDVMIVTEEHPLPEMLALLADSYPFQPCARCRHQALTLLTQHACVPDWLLAEAQLDAYPDTRTLVRSMLNPELTAAPRGEGSK